MITATVTRPTTISPTVTRSTKVKFQDQIDIESMSTPKSRAISLEPVSKRGRVKLVRGASSMTTQTTSSTGYLSRNNTQHSATSRSTNSITNPPLSPAPSEDTTQTNITTTSTPSFQTADAESPVRKCSPQTSDARSNTTSSSSQTITATAELPRHGALPGDTLPIRVSITHTKSDVRGMVLATLYRQGRVDMHPTIPLGNSGDKRPEYEDVYPKSRTGLGGLYFANASPSSVFRKDLAQSSTMMIVNPDSMTADITMSLKIPDSAFPTIANVPGSMISFTYHVEVVVDLFGKLGETRLWPRLTSSDPIFSHNSEAGSQLTSDWSQSILDTTQLRRTKSVITFEMSLVIGTHDSGRKRPLNKPLDGQNPEILGPWQEDYQDSSYPHGEYDGQFYDEMGQPYYDEDGHPYSYDPSTYPDDYYQAPDIIPPPEPIEEVDEKTRLRRQEQLLLPSAPPEDGEASSSAGPNVPSAPVIPSNGMRDGIEIPHDGSVTPSTLHTTSSVASARSGDTIRPHSSSPPPVPVSAGDVEVTDDKQELERQRLLAQASAPPAEEEAQPSTSVDALVPALAPSAPTITEPDEYNVQTLNHEHSGGDLPQYER